MATAIDERCPVTPRYAWRRYRGGKTLRHTAGMVTIRDLAAHLDDYVDRAAHGEVIVIADGGKPVAELVPPHFTPATERPLELARQGPVVMPTRPRLTFPTPGAEMRPGYALSDIVIELRAHPPLKQRANSTKPRNRG